MYISLCAFYGQLNWQKFWWRHAYEVVERFLVRKNLVNLKEHGHHVFLFWLSHIVMFCCDAFGNYCYYLYNDNKFHIYRSWTYLIFCMFFWMLNLISFVFCHDMKAHDDFNRLVFHAESIKTVLRYSYFKAFPFHSVKVYNVYS